MCICTNKESKEKKGTCKHTGSGAASTCSCNCDDCLDCRGSSCKKNCKPAAGNLSICKASQGNTLTVGQRDRACAHFNCGYSGNRHIGWRSSNPNVVKVDCYGNLTAVGEGSLPASPPYLWSRTAVRSWSRHQPEEPPQARIPW